LEEQRCSCLLCSSQRASPAFGIVRNARSPRAPWQRSASSCRARRATHVGRLPQNGREDKIYWLEIEQRTNPATLEIRPTNPPMHQLGTGSNRVKRTVAMRDRNVDQRLNSAP